MVRISIVVAYKREQSFTYWALGLHDGFPNWKIFKTSNCALFIEINSRNAYSSYFGKTILGVNWRNQVVTVVTGFNASTEQP